MEILVRLGSLLSPSFFAILAGLSLVAAALLFVAGKRGAAQAQVSGSKLSTLEPTEHRGTAYLVLASLWSIVGLVLSFVFAAIAAGPLSSLVLVILLLLCLLFTLCFWYAGGGTLLSAVAGQRGGAVRWSFAFMAPVDALIALFGDLLTASLFRQLGYPGIPAKTAKVREAEEPAEAEAAAEEEAKTPDEMERLLHNTLTKYEARLNPEQREKLMQVRRIVEELRSMYP